MRAPSFVLAASAVVLVALAAPSARAHQVGLSRGVWTTSGDRVEAELVFARPEVLSLAPSLDADSSGALDEGELSAGAPILRAAVVDRIAVTSEGAPCAGALEGASLTEEDGLALRAAFGCPSEARDVVATLAVLEHLSTGHRHLAHVVSGGGAADLVAFSGAPALRLTSPAAEAAPPVGAYFRIGVEHILIGLDHLLFLFALLLVGGRLRALLGVVTAFTLAHSITLGLATLGVYAPPPSVIEPLIALSIAYVGLENLFVKDAEKRWRITFPFGLVHGFGFAGALGEVGVPEGDVPLALLLFNLGVEAGQVLVLLLVVPALVALKKRGVLDERAVKVLSCAVIGMGLFWFVERVLG